MSIPTFGEGPEIVPSFPKSEEASSPLPPRKDVSAVKKVKKATSLPESVTTGKLHRKGSKKNPKEGAKITEKFEEVHLKPKKKGLHRRRSSSVSDLPKEILGSEAHQPSPTRKTTLTTKKVHLAETPSVSNLRALFDPAKSGPSQVERSKSPPSFTRRKSFAEIKARVEKKPMHTLGGAVTVRPEDIASHRSPYTEVVTASFVDSLSLKDAQEKIHEPRLKQEFIDANGREPNPREMSKIKEEAAQLAYDEGMARNIEAGVYNPAVIAAEMKTVLGVTDHVHGSFNSFDDVMDGIDHDLAKFYIPKYERGTKQKITQVLTPELRDHLRSDIKKTMELYHTVYPEKSWKEVFTFGRDLGRAAVYQVIFDKRSFTGSDHGVLHVHHNCENGENMHDHMEPDDMSDRVRLLARVMHFYHDIGYSVGAKEFKVKSDHPYISAAFIEANRDYFEHYLDKEATDIIKTSILYHAIVGFDSNPNDELAMVRFTTSNSDACAVAADQKTQSFWREHPKTLVPLTRLKNFLMIYPEYGLPGQKLSNKLVSSKPEEVFELRDKTLQPPELLSEDNFVDPMDFMAWNLFSTVKAELMAEATKQSLPEDEKKAFLEAIESDFNAFGGDIVLAQYGAELGTVSVELNPGSGPKYLPAIELKPSILFGILQSCYSDIASQNIRKVCKNEYHADLKEIDKALTKVSHGGKASRSVPSPVAKLTIKRQTETTIPESLKHVEETLIELNKKMLPVEARLKINQYIKDLTAANDEFLKAQTKEDRDAIIVKLMDATFVLADEIQRIINPDSEPEIRGNLFEKINDLIQQILSEERDHPITKEEFNKYVLAIRTAFTTDGEWEAMGLERPTITI